MLVLLLMVADFLNKEPIVRRRIRALGRIRHYPMQAFAMFAQNGYHESDFRSHSGCHVGHLK